MTNEAWTNEEEEAFNEVERNSNLGKQILKEMIDTGQPYHWEADAIKAAIKIEREACADIAENWNSNGFPRTGVAEQIRARGQA